ncbi:taurine dioxygenase [Natronospirillum operosum]|uniref:Taurine dioxygenase n=1 Tax=Natronospirillum operosum TaxID=2759953 RepID=A0A4Z0WHI1_9GAMM|nr:TauD/TfdA family dioxygenase [Natronospirillum operosum]TGG94258.1 taurine dioxygenase [Natronospirillum operosum]
MPYQHIKVTRLSPHVGAEIEGVDLTSEISDEVFAEIRKAFLDCGVIFFRDQQISFDDQIRFARQFGPLGKHVGAKTISKTTDNPLVRKFHYDETSTMISGENFHSDQSCAEVPPLGSMLYNHTVPPHNGGSTMFASMYAAYEALSEPMKQYLDGLTATHDGTRVFGQGTPVSAHPVVVKHPETGRKLLFVNTDFTSHINEVPRHESRRVLEFLYEHCAKPEWSCRFNWTPHSVALWDNRCTHHKAVWDYWPHVRSGYRVQIEGTTRPLAAAA